MLKNELENLVNFEMSEYIASKFKSRLDLDQKYTRDENPYSHFCVYFAAYDPVAKKCFIGLHKKSGFWLFNGGHIDEGQNIHDTLKREIEEEWGIDSAQLTIKNPELLTITYINNPTKQTCREHYDIWFLISVDKNKIKFDKKKLEVEFSEYNWFDYYKCKEVVKEKNTLIALDYIKKLYFD